MEKEKEPYFLGIDLNNQYAMISFFQLNMKEPETVSTVAGSELYQIPLILGKKKNIGQWYIGDEAKRIAKSSEMSCIDSLWKRSLAGETVRIDEDTYQAKELLVLFLRKLMLLPQKLGSAVACDRLVITVENLTHEKMDLLWQIAPQLGVNKNQLKVIDHKETFYYYALNQKPELWLHDVFLFEYSGENMSCYGLSRKLNTTPQMISITESTKNYLGGDKDIDFLELMQRAFENRIVSTVYLVGDGFDGGWMKSSLPFLCRGKRAFLGKNLFSKGACYAAGIFEDDTNWPFVYIGEHEMKFNLRLKVRNHGAVEFYDLISAGDSWYEAQGECELILSGTPEINFWKQLPHSREAVIETLELTDFPERPDRTSRLRVKAKPVSDSKIEIEIKDLGFGEIFCATDKTWKYTMVI